MRTWIELASSLDVDAWRLGHHSGSLPDQTPYGLDRLSESGHEVSVRPQPRTARRLDARAVRRLGGLQWVESLSAVPPPGTDVCLSWDERTGIPRAVRGGGPAAVVTGVIWLDDPGSYRFSHATARGLARCSLVWALSAAQLPRLVRMGAPADRVEHLQFGVDGDFFSPRPASEADPDLLVSVGNDRHRDWGTLMSAFAQLRRRRPSARLEVVTRTELPSAPGVTRRAEASHVELRELYARSSAVVLATRPNFHVSGMTAALEAQATARPVILSRTPGVEDYVVDGATGSLVPPGDALTLARSMESALDGAQSCVAEMGGRGREAVDRSLNTRAMTGRLDRLLRRYC